MNNLLLNIGKLILLMAIVAWVVVAINSMVTSMAEPSCESYGHTVEECAEYQFRAEKGLL